MLRHKVDRLGRHSLRGQDQITLVLAIGVIHHDHHLALPQIGDDGFDGIENSLHEERVIEMELRCQKDWGQPVAKGAFASAAWLTFSTIGAKSRACWRRNISSMRRRV